MCCGAIINSRIDDLIFGAYDLKSGSAVSVQKIFDHPYNYRPEVTGGVMEEECAAILSDFFRQLGGNEKPMSKSRLTWLWRSQLVNKLNFIKGTPSLARRP